MQFENVRVQIVQSKRFVFNFLQSRGLQQLTIITKCSILHAAAVLDPPLQSLLKQAFKDFVLISNPETHSVE